MYDIDMDWLWFILAVIFMSLEFLIPGAYFIWMALGAFMTGILIAFLVPEIGMAMSFVLFSVCIFGSIALGFYINGRAEKKRKKKGESPMNQEYKRFIGQTAKVVSKIESGRGRVLLGDTTYTALLHNPVSDIEKGELVEVVGHDGMTAVVKRIKKEAAE